MKDDTNAALYTSIIKECVYFCPMPLLKSCGLPVDAPGLGDNDQPLREERSLELLQNADQLMMFSKRTLLVGCIAAPAIFGQIERAIACVE